MSDEYSTGGGYQYELLKADNWMPWKRRMLAVFRDLGLEKYIAKDAKAPESADPAERCDVSLTGETTNTKHTHKRSEAQ
jgi:hypothetical protein